MNNQDTNYCFEYNVCPNILLPHRITITLATRTQV